MIDLTGVIPPGIAAHRGWHANGATENSIAALERAAASGVDMVELDVRQLGDGTLIVHHDAHIGGVPIEQLDRSILEYNRHISTLEDWSRRAGELDVPLLVELKSPGHEQRTFDTLRRHLPIDRLSLMSFEPSVVSRLREIAPDRPIGLLHRAQPAIEGAELVARAREAGASFIGPNVRIASDSMLSAAYESGMGVAVWTVDQGGDLRRLLGDPRVTTVISDVPEHALQLRDELYGSGIARRGYRTLQAAALAVR